MKTLLCKKWNSLNKNFIWIVVLNLLNSNKRYPAFIVSGRTICQNNDQFIIFLSLLVYFKIWHFYLIFAFLFWATLRKKSRNNFFFYNLMLAAFLSRSNKSSFSSFFSIKQRQGSKKWAKTKLMIDFDVSKGLNYKKNEEKKCSVDDISLKQLQNIK